MPFSATLQWDSPSDDGGSSLPLTYTITLTSTSTSLSNVTATSLPLPNLQHSTQYSWSVQAINEYGSSPPAEGTFTTPDSGEYAQVSLCSHCTCKHCLIKCHHTTYGIVHDVSILHMSRYVISMCFPLVSSRGRQTGDEEGCTPTYNLKYVHTVLFKGDLSHSHLVANSVNV